MTFEQRLQAALTTLAPAPAQNDAERRRDGAAALVAIYAPHLLKRFAALAVSLQALSPAGGQGVILACRNGPLGYRTVEYRSRDLHIVLDTVERESHLWWDANGETGLYLLTPDTTAHDLDGAILDVVAAFVRTHTPVKTGCCS